MQRAYLVLETMLVNIDLPSPEGEVLPGVLWGSVEGFPTPAYWAYQVLARRISADRIRNRLGLTLSEEVAACLLGGHGIPAGMGLLAFAHLKARGLFSHPEPTEQEIAEWLGEPIPIGGRTVRYRFVSQKARYLALVLKRLAREEVPTASGRILRDWLTLSPGIGYKTASWIARNWLDADDVAILDIHILRAGALAGFLDPTMTVEKHYLALEEQFLAFSKALGVRASELDAVIWSEMAASPASVSRALTTLEDSDFKDRHSLRRQLRSNYAKTNSTQLALLG